MNFQIINLIPATVSMNTCKYALVLISNPGVQTLQTAIIRLDDSSLKASDLDSKVKFNLERIRGSYKFSYITMILFNDDTYETILSGINANYNITRNYSKGTTLQSIYNKGATNISELYMCDTDDGLAKEPICMVTLYVDRLDPSCVNMQLKGKNKAKIDTLDTTSVVYLETGSDYVGCGAIITLGNAVNPTLIPQLNIQGTYGYPKSMMYTVDNNTHSSVPTNNIYGFKVFMDLLYIDGVIDAEYTKSDDEISNNYYFAGEIVQKNIVDKIYSLYLKKCTKLIVPEPEVPEEPTPDTPTEPEVPEEEPTPDTPTEPEVPEEEPTPDTPTEPEVPEEEPTPV